MLIKCKLSQLIFMHFNQVSSTISRNYLTLLQIAVQVRSSRNGRFMHGRLLQSSKIKIDHSGTMRTPTILGQWSILFWDFCKNGPCGNRQSWDHRVISVAPCYEHRIHLYDFHQMCINCIQLSPLQNTEMN